MRNISLKSTLRYIYDQLTGNFIGFLIGASATGLVSQFFETRGLKNLWGLTAKKTVVDKSTFQNLEWIISIVIGFIVFEIFTKVIKAQIEKHAPRYKRLLYRWIIRENLRERFHAGRIRLNEKRIVLFTSMHQGVKQAFNRFSNR